MPYFYLIKKDNKIIVNKSPDLELIQRLYKIHHHERLFPLYVITVYTQPAEVVKLFEPRVF